jgi:tRNA nucleotidyltransferase (CCA-adding enzyme)
LQSRILMEIYLVGGAVRDKLLGQRVTERDWVVVGATPKEMLAKKFKLVGKDFPVFLHPKTHEEYALARTERKVGKGYKGFACYFSPDVTLEDDLKRRDLTINAIAQTPTGELIDPYDGIKDLHNKILRHVSEAFAEDPVRILRVARFASRFGDFKVHASTNRLMLKMLHQGEVDALVPERVWQEFEQALAAKFPVRFFEVLQDCGVFTKLFPEIAQHFKRTKILLNKAVKANLNSIQRFALLFFYANEDAIKTFCKRYRVPNAYRELALMIVQYQQFVITALEFSAADLLMLFERTDAFRRPERFREFLQTCAVCETESSLKKIHYLKKCYKVVAGLNIKEIIKDIEKTKIKTAIKAARLQLLQKTISLKKASIPRR